MTKQTKRVRKNKNRSKNRTKSIKYYGGALEVEKDTNSKGIFTLIGDKLSNYTGKITNYIKDKGLRLAGLEPIKKENDMPSAEIDQKVNEIGSAASGLVASASGLAASAIGNVNEVLGSPQLQNSLNNTASETAEIGTNLLENVNEKLSTPEFKEAATEAIDNVADYTNILVKAIDEPLNNSIDTLNKAGTKAMSGIASGAIKVGTDVLAAVPGAGAVIELGKMANDASAAAGDVVEATTDATTAVANIVKETTENMEEGIDDLKNKELEAKQIGGRINKSINLFENPLQSKTRRKFLNHNVKSRRR
jgi:hypothetical protein